MLCFWTHALAPLQSGGVMLLDEGLHLGPDWQVGAHPVHVAPVAGRAGRDGGRRGVYDG